MANLLKWVLEYTLCKNIQQSRKNDDLRKLIGYLTTKAKEYKKNDWQNENASVLIKDYWNMLINFYFMNYKF